MTEVESLRQQVFELKELLQEARNRAERLELQLVGCSVAAGGHATGTNDAPVGCAGWSPAFEDVKLLRAEFDRYDRYLRHTCVKCIESEPPKCPHEVTDELVNYWDGTRSYQRFLSRSRRALLKAENE